MGSMSVSSCRCRMFLSCVHPVAVLNAAFCMTCILLILVEDATGDHMEEAQNDTATSGVAVTAVTKKWCRTFPTQQWGPDLPFLGQAAVVLGGYLHILCAHSVQSSCTLYQLPYLNLFIENISQIQNCLCVFVGPGFVSTSPAFMRSSASHPVGPHGRLAKKPGKSGPHCWGREGSTQFAHQFVIAVTAPPLAGCIIWNHSHQLFNCIHIYIKLTGGKCQMNSQLIYILNTFYSNNTIKRGPYGNE